MNDQRLPTIPHTSKVWAIKDPPRTILHVQATIAEVPASTHAGERHDLRKAVAEAVGNGRAFDDAVIYWMPSDA